MDLYALFEFQVSVQAFNDEDPQGRRTLGNVHGNIFFKIICPIRTSITRDKYLISGLFLHRRKAEITDSYRKVSLSLDKMKLDYVFICFCVSAPFYFHIFDQKVSNYYLLSCWYYWLIFSGSYVCGFSWKGYCSLSGKSKFLYIYTNPKGTCCDFAFFMPVISWYAHQREKSWCLGASNRGALFYQRLQRDGAGAQLCCLMSLLIFSKMGPWEWLLSCSSCDFYTR